MNQKLENLLESILPHFRKWIHNINEYNHLYKLIKSIKRTKVLDKTIIINLVRNYRFSLDSEVFFGLIFALNGAKVKVLIDDGLMMHWDTYKIDTLPFEKKDITTYSLNPYYLYYNNRQKIFRNVFEKNIRKKALNTYQDENIEYIYYSEFLNNQNVNYEKLEDLKKYAESSTVRFFKTTELDYEDKIVKYYYNLSLKNAALSRQVGEFLFKNIDFDYFTTSHAIYSTYRPVFDYLKDRGVKLRVFGGAKLYTTDYRDIIYTDSKTQTLSQSEFWLNYLDTYVTDDMIKKVSEFFEMRLGVVAADMKWLDYMKRENLFIVDKNDGYKYHVCIFPNVIWDGNINDRHVAFNGVLDWVLTTIEILKNRKDVKFYIKAHPGEIHFCKDSDRIIDMAKKYSNLEGIENLVLIPPEKRIHTYKFLKSGIDLAIVYDGMLNIEIPLLEIPTIMCAKGGYISVEGGNFIVDSKEQYRNYLSNIQGLIEEFHQNYEKYFKNIVRYAYWYLYESNIKLPTINPWNGHFRFDLTPLKKEDLKLDEKFLEIFK